MLTYPPYRAVVTAHFPDEETSHRARERFAVWASSTPDLIAQWFDGPPQDNATAVKAGASSLLVHLEDVTRGQALVRLCQEAGATLATFYPARSVVATQTPTRSNLSTPPVV